MFVYRTILLSIFCFFIFAIVSINRNSIVYMHSTTNANISNFYGTTAAGFVGYTYSGMCDGSAAVALNNNTFIVASDETYTTTSDEAHKDKASLNILAIYRTDQGGAPLQTIELTKSLTPDPNNKKQHDPKHPEADIEAATRNGNRIYWITSHGHNAAGKNRADRYRFFATDIVEESDPNSIRLAGVNTVFPAYMNLIKDISNDTRYSLFNLKKLDDEEIAPESGGINIEGMTIAKDNGLLIGFRSPLIDKKALLIPLENPDGLIEGKDTSAKVGKPILLDLGGLGIRDIQYSKEKGIYIIIAGSVGPENNFKLYQWSGVAEQSPSLMKDQSGKEFDLSGLNPEAIVIYPNTKAFQILSDDGDFMVKSAKSGIVGINKELVGEERLFRSIWVPLP